MLLNTLNASRTDALTEARPDALVSTSALATAMGMCDSARTAYATTTGLTNGHVIGAVRQEWIFAPNGTKHDSQRERRT